MHNFYFRLHPGSIRSPQVIEFLQALHRQIPGKILLLWDGAPIHRSKLVTAYLAGQTDWLHVERLPAYAPELNPVEYLWAYWKKHELANFCPKDVWQLSHAASQALKRIRVTTRSSFASVMVRGVPPSGAWASPLRRNRRKRRRQRHPLPAFVFT